MGEAAWRPSWHGPAPAPRAGVRPAVTSTGGPGKRNVRNRARVALTRYCRCGTRLARDNPAALCAVCQAKARDLLLRPPQVPAEFWENDRMRDALAAWHIGQVIVAYRNHPYHGRPILQAVVARWLYITQSRLSRIETGPPVKDLDKLISWTRILGVPPHLLWFKLPEYRHLPLYGSDVLLPL